jgi:hypothetical protein
MPGLCSLDLEMQSAKALVLFFAEEILPGPIGQGGEIVPGSGPGVLDFEDFN